MTKLISDKYLALYQKAHKDTSGRYGATSSAKYPYVKKKVLDKYDVKTILDYGCGTGDLINKLNNEGYECYGYDPAVIEYQYKPKAKFDLVVALDLLEHIEEEYVDNVLEDIKNYTNEIALFYISRTTGKPFPGTSIEQHVLGKKSPEWWSKKITPYFKVLESTNESCILNHGKGRSHITFVLEPIDDK